jgi:hypothetical protein
MLVEINPKIREEGQRKKVVAGNVDNSSVVLEDDDVYVDVICESSKPKQLELSLCLNKIVKRELWHMFYILE